MIFHLYGTNFLVFKFVSYNFEWHDFSRAVSKMLGSLIGPFLILGVLDLHQIYIKIRISSLNTKNVIASVFKLVSKVFKIIM